MIHVRMAQIGTVGGEIWQNGGEKWGSRHGQVDVCPGPVFSTAQSKGYLWMLSLETAIWVES